MSVKGIFKILIGTIVIMVVSSLVIEMLNISISALQLNNVARMAINQSCTLFTQETYKTRDSATGIGGAVNLDSVEDADGAEYIDGSFYNSGTPEEVYMEIYSSDAFKVWMKSVGVEDKWESLDLINRGINNPLSLNVAYPSNNASQSQVDEYTNAMLAKSYRDTLMTPANLGVPYLHQETLNRIFRWNLAQVASNCNPYNIHKDDEGKTCVFYKGFKIHADEASVTNISYIVYDLTTSEDRKDFENLTGIKASNLGYELDKDLLGSDSDERNYVCVAGVEFSVPVTYEGITPIRRIFSYVWDQEVAGINGSTREGTETHEWNGATADLKSGGFNGNNSLSDVLPVPGKVIFYLIR